MGLQLKIPRLSFNNNDLPRIMSEPMLTYGSLLLVDPTHSYKTFNETLFPTGLTIPNIASEQAYHLVKGQSDATVVNSFANGANRIIERTEKGGIHVIISENPTSPAAFEINLPNNIRDYMATNINHQFYISLWHRVTRAQPDSIKRNFSGYTHNDVNYLWVFDAQGDLPKEGTAQRIGAHQTTDGKANGNIFRSIGVQGPTQGWGTIGTPQGKAVFRVGNNNLWNNTGGSGAYPSQILYRAYIEDLTVSGRTYAEVDAIDYALYQKEVETVGGRYYGDTFTDPVTIP